MLLAIYMRIINENEWCRTFENSRKIEKILLSKNVKIETEI